MSADHFRKWVAAMKAARGWSKAECSRQLGCGINQIAVWSETGAPPYIALACAALVVKLEPYR